jgi:hypothetical protein
VCYFYISSILSAKASNSDNYHSIALIIHSMSLSSLLCFSPSSSSAPSKNRKSKQPLIQQGIPFGGNEWTNSTLYIFCTRGVRWLFDLQLGLAVCAARPVCWPSNDLWKSSSNVVFLGSIFATFFLVFFLPIFFFLFSSFPFFLLPFGVLKTYLFPFFSFFYFLFCCNIGLPIPLMFFSFSFSFLFCCNIGLPSASASISLMLFFLLFFFFFFFFFSFFPPTYAKLSPPPASSFPSPFHPSVSRFFRYLSNAHLKNANFVVVHNA